MVGESNARVVDADLAVLAAALTRQLDELVEEAAKLVRAQIPFYADASLVGDQGLRDALRVNLLAALSRLAVSPTPADPRAARRTGELRAAAGTPLSALMDSYRIGTRFLWDKLVQSARETGTVTDAALVLAASELWMMQDEFTQAMVIGYREEQTAQVVAREEERSALVGALLEGHVLETSSLWEIADILQIGTRGPYAVIAAELTEVGRRSLHAVESALRGFGVESAWRLTSDLQVGIVRVPGEEQTQALLSTLRQRATTRIGISPPYLDLAATAPSLRLARIALAGSVPGKDPVTVFNHAALAITAVSTPDVNRRVAEQVLAGLDSIPPVDRALLMDTFEAWLDCAGSTVEAAARLFCHHNTVRHRLRRLEVHTGRMVSVPRELTELCIALEIERRLPTISTTDDSVAPRSGSGRGRI